MSVTFSGNHQSQDPGELRRFIDLLISRGVRSYCEIGARHGDTFHAVMSSLPVGSFGMAVDLPNGAWGKKGTDSSLNRAADDLRKRGYDVEVVLGNSHSPEVRQRVGAFSPFDALFIDADHTLDGVKTDWLAYKDMAAMVALHDINGEGQIDKARGLPIEVHKLWRELRQEYGHVELVNTAVKFGIGALFVEETSHVV